MSYDAFLSYSHSADSSIALTLQSTLEKIAKPWHRRRALNIFRDQTDLSTAPNLWGKIASALSQSKFFILLASPEAASSEWVNKEIEWFLQSGSPSRVLIVLTHGRISWDEEVADFDWKTTDALPPSLKGVFHEEPLFLDLRDFSSTREKLSYRNIAFKERVASIAASIHGISIRDLAGEEIRQFKKTARLRDAVIATLSVLFLTVAFFAWYANNQRNEARAQLAEANHNLGLTVLSKALDDLREHNWNYLRLHSLYALKYLKETALPERRTALSNLLRGPEYAVLRTIPNCSHHDSKVTSVCFSPKARILASGSDDRTVKLWDLSTGSEMATLRRHAEGVTSVCFSPDGKILASGSWDATIVLWDVDKQEIHTTLFGHSYAVNVVRFSPDGRDLASGSDDGTVRLWNTETHQMTRELTIEGYGQSVQAVGFSPDGKHLAAGTHNGDIVVFNLSTGKADSVLKENYEPILSVSFSPDGKLIASGNQDETIRLWSFTSPGPPLTIHCHSGLVRSACFSPDGATLASGSDSLQLWDVGTGIEQKRLPGHAGSILSVDYSPDGKMLVSGSFDETVRLWDAVTGNGLGASMGHTQQVGCVAFSPDGKVLASADETIRLLDLEQGKEVKSLREPMLVAQAMTFLPDGKHIAAADDYHAAIYSIETGMIDHSIEATPTGTESFAFSPKGDLIASGTREYEGNITLWDPNSGRCLASFGEHNGEVNALCFSPDATMLASGSGSDYRTGYPELNSIKIWNVISKKAIQTLNGHMGPVTSIAFSPNGMRLAAGSSDGTIKLWSMTTFQEIRTIRGHSGRVNSICFSSDQNMLASGSDDTKAKIFDAHTGAEIASLSGHTGGVTCVRISGDNQTLATGSKDKTTKLWDISKAHDRFAINRDSGRVRMACFSPGLRLVASMSAGDVKTSVLALRDARTGDNISLFPHEVYDNTPVFSSDGTSLALVAELGFEEIVYFKKEALTVWDIASHRIINTFTIPCCINTMCFSPDNKLLAATTGSDIRRLARRILIYDLESNTQFVEFPRGDDYDNCIAFSADGKTLASGSEFKKIILWNLEKKEENETMYGHAGPITSLTYSADGRFLASGSEDQSIKVWDPRNRIELATLRGHTGTVNELAFSENGALLASGANDSTVRIWDCKSWQELAVIPGYHAALFSSDAHRLGAVSLDNRETRVWDVSLLLYLDTDSIERMIKVAEQKYGLSLSGVELRQVVGSRNLFRH